jgi:putative YhbY family RNA-binding protein
MPELTSKRRSELRAEAHKLNPVVIIGDKGLTDEVLAEIDRALKAHELIKVRAATDDRDARDVWMESICAKLEAHPVQQIGKILVVYREQPKEEKKKPVAAAQAGAASARSSAKKRKSDPRLRGDDQKRRDEQSATRTGRPRSRTASPLPASGSRRRRPRTSR